MQDQLTCRVMRVRHIRQLLSSIDTPDATIVIQPMLEPLTIEAFEPCVDSQPLTHSQFLAEIDGEEPDGLVIVHTPVGPMGVAGFLKGVPLVLFVSPSISQPTSN